MASKFRVRYFFRPLVTIIAKGLIKIKVTPNLATVIMLCFSVLCFISLAFFQNLLCFSIFVVITGIMDGCDGAIARLTNKSTKFGGLFDSFMDRVSEFFIFLGLGIYNKDQFLWNLIDMKLIIFISFFSSILISYSRARAEVFFKGDYDIGLMARSERLFYLFISMMFAFFFGFMKELLFIYLWLVVGTYLFRMIRIYYRIKSKDNNLNK
ncbi:MAG: CDP-alcohol phosphatidyltransferase family protein [Candidatus Thorarchaeota archaeon]